MAETPELVVNRTLQQFATTLAADLKAEAGYTISIVTGVAPRSGDLVLDLVSDTTLGGEGYKTQVTGGIATVKAQTAQGAYLGTRSLLQQYRLQGSIPGGEITDAPASAYRAISIDMGRRYWAVDSIKELIRSMSWNKLNVLQLHLNEDEGFRLYSPDYPSLAPTDAGARYNEQQIDEIEAFANDRGVTIVPEIDLPAHAAAIAHLGGQDRSLGAKCASTPRSSTVLDYADPANREWAINMVTHFADWFEGPYFHTGNDEVPHELEDCAYIADAIAADPDVDDFYELQERFANEEAAALEAQGKRAMMWANADLVQPSTDIILVNFGSRANAQKMRSLGYDVVDTSYGGTYTRFFLIAQAFGDDRHVGRGKILGATLDEAGGNNLGYQMAVWADASNFAQDRFFLDEIAIRSSELAERTWKAGASGATYADFKLRVEALGSAPGTSALPSRTPNGQPDHRYTFDSATAIGTTTHYPAGLATGLQIQDDVAGGLRATSTPGPGTQTTGIDGKAVKFTKGSQQRVFTGVADVAPPWTWSAWVNKQEAGTDSLLARSWASAIKAEQNNTGKVGLTKYGVGDYSFEYTLPSKEWVHLAVVADPEGTTLFANGVSVSRIPQTTSAPFAAIGGPKPFGGFLDDARFYDEALSTTQVAQLHAQFAPTAPNESNVALGKPATASSSETTALTPGLAVDGSTTTRWSSQRSDSQWLQVDLGAAHQLSEVIIDWESAYGKNYEIQVSKDGQSWTTAATVTNGNGGIDETALTAGTTARYVRMLGLQRGTTYGYSIHEMQILGTTNVALGKPATASSSETTALTPGLAVDGSKSTRWSSQRTDSQWLQVDLGAAHPLSKVVIDWENAYGKNYEIQVSNDGQSWTTAATVTNGNGGIDETALATGTTGRYVRMLGLQRGTTYGYSIHEMRILG